MQNLAASAKTLNSEMRASSQIPLKKMEEQSVYQKRRDAQGGFIEHQAFRFAHQRPTDGQHLLLAAAERPGGLLLALLEPGKIEKM